MNGLFYNIQRMALFPLQSRRGYDFALIKEGSQEETMIVVIGLGSIIVIGLVVHFIRFGFRRGKKGSPSGPRRFSPLSLRRIIAPYGLDKDQRKLLEFVFRNNAVDDPARALKNPAILDKHFKRAFKVIEQTADSEEDAQRRLAQLFSLRNAIESAPGIGGGISSTAQIGDNTPVVLSTGRNSYPVHVISTKGETLLAEAPRNSLGSPIKVAKGTRVTLSVFTKSSKGFAFDTRVIGYADTSHGTALELAHSGKSKPLAQRRFRRKETNARCTFNLVFVETKKAGRKQTQKMVVDSRRHTGTILDISAGGCSIKTSAPLQVGSRLKIEIVYSDESIITVLGQVIRTNRSGGVGTIIYTKFLKVPRRAFNDINAMVFGYDEG